MDLVADPVAVLHTVAQRELESGLCVLLGRMSTPAEPQPLNVDGENSALPALSPCDVRPRKGMPSHC
jgi:hypothetical protein